MIDLNMDIPTSLEKKRFDMNAEPVAFLQFVQWQIRKVMGSPMISYFIDLHKQDPDRSVEEDILLDVRREEVQAQSSVRTWRSRARLFASGLYAVK